MQASQISFRISGGTFFLDKFEITTENGTFSGGGEDWSFECVRVVHTVPGAAPTVTFFRFTDRGKDGLLARLTAVTPPNTGPSTALLTESAALAIMGMLEHQMFLLTSNKVFEGFRVGKQ